MTKAKSSALREQVREALTGAVGWRRTATFDMPDGTVRVMTPSKKAVVILARLGSEGFVLKRPSTALWIDVKAGPKANPEASK